MAINKSPKMNYRVRNIRLEDYRWVADVTTWEGCCSNIKYKVVKISKEKRPTTKDFIKELSQQQ